MSGMYFSPDGNYGDALGLVILDTTGWSPDATAVFDGMSESERINVAQGIADGLGSIDQQDCPAFTGYDMDELCDWSGYVYREFITPSLGEDGGYTWTCPMCQTPNDWEGEPVSETGESYWIVVGDEGQWSNEFGWTEASGTRFTAEECGQFTLPLGGRWQEVTS